MCWFSTAQPSIRAENREARLCRGPLVGWWKYTWGCGLCTDILSNCVLSSLPSSVSPLTGTNKMYTISSPLLLQNFDLLALEAWRSKKKSDLWISPLSSILSLLLFFPSPSLINNKSSLWPVQLCGGIYRGKWRIWFLLQRERAGLRGGGNGFLLTRFTLKGNGISVSKPPNFNWVS